MLVRRRSCLLCLALALVLGLASAQNSPRSPPLFPHRMDYGRNGLCPYVKRVIPYHSHNQNQHSHLGNSGEPPSLCGNLCTSDHACPAAQKCCPTHCGYACFDPVFIAD